MSATRTYRDRSGLPVPRAEHTHLVGDVLYRVVASAALMSAHGPARLLVEWTGAPVDPFEVRLESLTGVLACERLADEESALARYRVLLAHLPSQPARVPHTVLVDPARPVPAWSPRP